jgi:penicillin-binding protein 2
MNHLNPVKQTLTRRSLVFGVANLGAAGLLLGRLYHLQFTQADQYTTLAEDNRVKLQLIAPVRGMILDRHGAPLAVNEKNFRLYLDTESRKNFRETLASLSQIIPLSAERIEDILEEATASRFAPPVLIKEHLTWEELAKFEFSRLRYPEVYVDTGQLRSYPYGEKASHLLGYMVAIDKKKASEGMEKLSRLPDFRIGRSGAEEMLESRLQGKAGVRQTEVNVHGLFVRELGRTPYTPGENVALTIDAKLQAYAAARLGQESAAAVVMNVHDGDVLALVSMPSYDSNAFSRGISTRYWKELQANTRNPLLNKAIAGQYPPGSTFKLCVGLAALDADVTSPDTHVYCNGRFMFGNHQFTCWKPSGHGSMNLHSALAQSCDVYFYTMAQRLGIDRIAGMARKLGLGKPTGLGIIGEKGGIVPDDAWKRASYDQAWQGGDTINVGIGQGYVIATPLQLAVMTARIANGGFYVSPRLVASAEPVKRIPLGISEDYINAIQDGMNAVANLPGGTAYGKRITDPRFLMAGKTGTSQVRKLIQHGLDQNKLPWEQRHHAWFVAYAPVQAPKYAISVIVEHGGGGAATAAPIARDILLKIQSIDAGEEGPPMPGTGGEDGEGQAD